MKRGRRFTVAGAVAAAAERINVEYKANEGLAA